MGVKFPAVEAGDAGHLAGDGQVHRQGDQKGLCLFQPGVNMVGGLLIVIGGVLTLLIAVSVIFLYQMKSKELS